MMEFQKRGNRYAVAVDGFIIGYITEEEYTRISKKESEETQAS